MGVTNKDSGTRIDEVAAGIYRISTPVGPAKIPGGFSFNQYLVVDDEPLLFHTGLRNMFPLLREAIATVLPPSRLRWIAFSHFEADECGALNELLAEAPHAFPVCSQVGAHVSVDDFADRPARALAEGESLAIGKKTLTWIDTPQVPHAWDCGFLFERTTRTLFCGDLFTQPGDDTAPSTDGDIFGPSEVFRRAMDYYSHTKDPMKAIERLAALDPTTLACMHGSAWRGDGARLLRELGRALARATP
jgi:flavorubredoxin